ncbi:unnamed protein product [Rhizoctonia solani]|uniref:Uncharacterized protein n=1 Tax=Rhizoctonia solani TaxID=456999 RepID=A0A8H2ZZS5_9AGAM|nr:unnamed protein product [Rhizoctonia solani]
MASLQDRREYEISYYDTMEHAARAAATYMIYGETRKPARGIPSPVIYDKIEKYRSEYLLEYEEEEEDTEETTEGKPDEGEGSKEEKKVKKKVKKRPVVGFGVRKFQYSPLVPLLYIDYEPPRAASTHPRYKTLPWLGLHFNVRALNKHGYIDDSKRPRSMCWRVEELESSHEELQKVFVKALESLSQSEIHQVLAAWE